MENGIPENKSFKLVIGDGGAAVLKLAIPYGLLVFSLITTVLLQSNIFYIFYFIDVLVVLSFIAHTYYFYSKNSQILKLKNQAEKQDAIFFLGLKLKHFWIILGIVVSANLMITAALYAAEHIFLSFILFFFVIVAQSVRVAIRDLMAGRKLSVVEIITSILVGLTIIIYFYFQVFRVE